jgi:hypothetical protein
MSILNYSLIKNNLYILPLDPIVAMMGNNFTAIQAIATGQEH